MLQQACRWRRFQQAAKDLFLKALVASVRTGKIPNSVGIQSYKGKIRQGSDVHLFEPGNIRHSLRKHSITFYWPLLAGFTSSARGQKGRLGGSLPESQMMVLLAISQTHHRHLQP
jgi:hypothetical protein